MRKNVREPRKTTISANHARVRRKRENANEGFDFALPSLALRLDRYEKSSMTEYGCYSLTDYNPYIIKIVIVSIKYYC